MPHQLTMSPATNTKHLLFCGDFIDIQLTDRSARSGKAYLRTNINHSETRQLDIIESVEKGRPMLDPGWHDTPMEETEPGKYSLTLPLMKIAHFACKAYILTEDGDHIWPEGSNIIINVAPGWTRSNNSVYCAFVRQFGENKALKSTPSDEEIPGLKTLENKNYTVIPPSGTFRDLIKELDHIFYDLGCRILHLLPINPTPTVYARMGRFGSPYAALSFTDVNPELAEFDLHNTPLEQFQELIDGVHARSGRIFLDIAINHTGWASSIHGSNPEWLKRHKDGRIHQPGAWGTVWEDLTELDHSNKKLWIYLADVFLTWCERGVDGFRCDAGYMVPPEAWRYIVAKVRMRFPSTVFLLEGLGGPWETTEHLLNEINLNWAYSELFQNYNHHQISEYIDYSTRISKEKGTMIHYAETHDNSRLAAKGKKWARMRTALSALLSHNGAFGFTNGVEWFADEKILVHRACGLNWGNRDNQIKEISTLNKLLRRHPSFHEGSHLIPIPVDNHNCLAYLRKDRYGKSPLIVIINLDCDNPQELTLNRDSLPKAFQSQQHFKNLLNEKQTWNHLHFKMSIGEAVCLAPEKDSLAHYEDDYQERKFRELVIMKLLSNCGVSVSKTKVQTLAKELYQNPFKVFHKLNILTTTWSFPHDLKRDVVYAPDTVLIFQAPESFRLNSLEHTFYSFQAADTNHYVLFKPLTDEGSIAYHTVNFELYGKEPQRHSARILRSTTADVAYKPLEPSLVPTTILDTNGRGGMMHLNLSHNALSSRYDSILAANLSTEFPENRHIMWTRCRLFSSRQALTYRLDEKLMESCKNLGKGAEVIFRTPVGLGNFARIRVRYHMINDHNATQISIDRLPASDSTHLEDEEPVQIILRPDIEDRNFHMETKSFGQLENLWPNAIKTVKGGFEFSPVHDRTLRMTIDKGDFLREDEWMYANYLSNEASRGLEAHSDLYSPGAFSIELQGNESVHLLGQILTPKESQVLKPSKAVLPSQSPNFAESLKNAIGHYVVKRGDLKTVIAGYPWFLDWGRDTLICARGLISAGFDAEVEKILLQFASFEEDGTLPNMIHGSDASNRDTTDAPLWFIVACEDLCRCRKSKSFLQKEINGRTIQQVIQSIVDNYRLGTKNGIQMDSESGLIYSPSHFTWMDTNYPAGTPRQGYPIEIQALWFRSLQFLGEESQNQELINLSHHVQLSVRKYFVLKDKDYLSDCLHCRRGEAAEFSYPDDALRCNQIFAVTLGLIDGELARNIVLSSESLIVPGAIRSLADQEVKFALPVTNDHGHNLNDPHRPFWGHYEGDEDTRRKPAYHNGTAWSWPFPSYCEALLMTFGKPARNTALAILNSSRVIFDTGCLAQAPEIIDGHSPHKARGCDGQAWGVTELYRVLRVLND